MLWPGRLATNPLSLRGADGLPSSWHNQPVLIHYKEDLRTLKTLPPAPADPLPVLSVRVPLSNGRFIDTYNALDGRKSCIRARTRHHRRDRSGHSSNHSSRESGKMRSRLQEME